ncbi:MAG: hypothetical protein ACC631_04630 [Halocynthiibacter sp.]
MLRTVSSFYLISMITAFAIALWLAFFDLNPAIIMTLAMMAWPMAALLLLAKKKVVAIRGGRR